MLKTQICVIRLASCNVKTQICVTVLNVLIYLTHADCVTSSNQRVLCCHNTASGGENRMQHTLVEDVTN